MEILNQMMMTIITVHIFIKWEFYKKLLVNWIIKIIKKVWGSLGRTLGIVLD
jgi:hypothetical protein